MIDKNKQYRTRDGLEVRIYATDGASPYSIHGAVYDCGKWHPDSWAADGRAFAPDKSEDADDLIEVKPRIKREVWVNVYRQDDGYEFATYHDNAIDAESESGDDIVARACLTVDVEEGEGL